MQRRHAVVRAPRVDLERRRARYPARIGQHVRDLRVPRVRGLMSRPGPHLAVGPAGSRARVEQDPQDERHLEVGGAQSTSRSAT